MIRKFDINQIQSYLEDTSNFNGGSADELLIPSDINEVVDILKEYSGKKKPLTISGAGTGTVAGRIPLGGGIMSTEKLDKIIDIDKNKMKMRVEPGVTVKKILEELSKDNLFYPSWPTEKLSFIGGNVSTNASGEYSYRFGSVRNYVTGLKIVLSTGEILNIKRGEIFSDSEGCIHVDDLKIKLPSYKTPDIKNSAGYYSKPYMDLIDLFIGSEGTLGVVVEIELKISKKLPPSFSLIVFFSREIDHFNFFYEIKQLSGNTESVNPLCIESFDRNSLEFLRKKYPNIPENVEGAIFIEQEYTGNQEKILEKWNEISQKHNPIDIWFAEDEISRDKFMDFRHKLPECINEYFRSIKLQKISLDIAVPYKNFGKLIDFYKYKLKNKNLHYVLFGHIGECHLHFNLFPQNEKEKQISNEIYEDCAKEAISLGGTISAEHGIGKLKHKYLEMMYGKAGILEMVNVKKVLDPTGILGRGNIFPEKYLN